jgi:hypothetical protein
MKPVRRDYRSKWPAVLNGAAKFLDDCLTTSRVGMSW